MNLRFFPMRTGLCSLKPMTLKPEKKKPTRWRFVDNFKISAGGGKSKGISSSISIWIGSTESTNKKAGILIDKFGLDGKDNNVLHFDFTDFEARENNIYSVEVTASRDTGETTTKTITVTVLNFLHHLLK
jgi:hypothetical protein